MRKIILDCDPGHDDAFALLLAGKDQEIDLLGITVVSGNQTLEKTGINTLNLCQYLDIKTPVCLGASRPLIKEEEVCEVIHGDSGLDGFEFPNLKIGFDPRNACDFIIQTLLESKDKITFVTTGPLTNLALAMRIQPKIIDKIKEVIVMGGSIANGNVTPAAEFNIYTDPEAAHIVFKSGAPIKMFGLDVTRKLMVLPEIIERMKKINNSSSKLFVDLMKVFNENQFKVFALPGGPLHDPITIAYLIDPKIATLKKVHCTIDLSHGSSYGRTNIDVFDYQHLPKNIEVAVDVNVDRFWDLIEDAIRK
ncbi:MAG: nucleoside hydrolase [Candidatus Izemoplasmatales bacterium]|uniref:Nucleoside hydrolase n=1 Tax=Hujiaoplasma nucleasis TaxID=2725268 RepID=A0A7L6N5P3_9MOLU|nr:nucleoside hydrolase [Hujiaoplasma nucleasis]QLY40812.1 nucleoside hydrolase [Hujiaoplasma nucleasis]